MLTRAPNSLFASICPIWLLLGLVIIELSVDKHDIPVKKAPIIAAVVFHPSSPSLSKDSIMIYKKARNSMSLRKLTQ